MPYWSADNPNIVVEKELNLPRVTVWCAISSSGIIGPFFFDIAVTSQSDLANAERKVLALCTIPRNNVSAIRHPSPYSGVKMSLAKMMSLAKSGLAIAVLSNGHPDVLFLVHVISYGAF